VISRREVNKRPYFTHKVEYTEKEATACLERTGLLYFQKQNLAHRVRMFVSTIACNKKMQEKAEKEIVVHGVCPRTDLPPGNLVVRSAQTTRSNQCCLLEVNEAT